MFSKKKLIKKIETLKDDVEKLRSEKMDRIAEDVKTLRQLAKIHEKLILSNHNDLEELEKDVDRVRDKKIDEKIEEEIDKIYG